MSDNTPQPLLSPEELREQLVVLMYNASDERDNKTVGEAADEIMKLVNAHTARKETEARLDAEEMTYRYAIQTLTDTDKEFALENLQRQLDKNLHIQTLNENRAEQRKRNKLDDGWR